MRAAAVLVLLLAGCVDPDPGEDGNSSWTAVEADLWFTQASGCISCGLYGATSPQASVLAVYRDGSLLWYSFAMGPGDITFAPGLEPWQDEVLAVHAGQHDNWSRDMSYVAEIHTTRAHSWPSTETRLIDIHSQLQDPGPDDRSDCADCGGPWVEALDPHVHAALFQNYEEGDPWDRLLDELGALRDQLDGEWGG